MKPARLAGHAFGWGLLMLLVGWLSSAPPYRHLPPGQATLKLSLRHAGAQLGECRSRSAEELARLPPTARAAQVCPRERSPLELEMLIGGRVVVHERIEPRGLHRDGLASIYRRMNVPAGEHDLIIHMKDNIQDVDFKWIKNQRIRLNPAQVVVIDFDPARGGFVVN